MEVLSPNYMIELAQQLAFVSAFLGGFAATYLATLIVANSSKKSADWSIGFAACAASFFIVAVIASVMITVVLHSDAPSRMSEQTSISVARVVSTLGFIFGIYALLASVGISGWLRSRKLGMVTSTCAALAVIIISWAFIGFS